MQKEKGPWLENVKKKVEVIHEHFRNYMREIGCDGQICFDAPGDIFSTYGIRIMVSHFISHNFMISFFLVVLMVFLR